MYVNLDYDVPPVESCRWKNLTRPLLEFIEKGDRSIAVIIAWGREQERSGTLTRHMLAWLSFNDLVYYVAPSAAWRFGAEPAGIAETWDRSGGGSPKSRRLLEPIPDEIADSQAKDPDEEDLDSSDNPEDLPTDMEEAGNPGDLRSDAVSKIG